LEIHFGEKSPYKAFETFWKLEMKMNHAEADYVNEGARYERANNSEVARAIAYKLRAMLSSESPEDQTYARELIEKGRKEARA